MADRYNAFIVVLDRDIREDDAEPIIVAIRQLKGVAEVIPHVADFDSNIARLQAKLELQDKMFKVFQDE